ncbi:MAG: hypothetical protein R3C16_07130 [Hyphomonadaceae bacterium]
MLMALSACANVEQTAHAASPSAVAAIPEEHAVPEFHGARIGRDTLRSRLPSEG